MDEQTAKREYAHLTVQPRDFTRGEFEDLRGLVAEMGREWPPTRRGMALDRPPYLTKRQIDHDDGFVFQRTRDRRRCRPMPVGSRGYGTVPRIDGKDVYQGAILACLEHLFGLPLADSTWTAEEWRRSVDLARTADPDRADAIGTPDVVLRNDRWCGPEIRNASQSYTLRFCVDGRAYATRIADGRNIAFFDHAAAARWIRRDRTEVWTGRSQWPVRDADVREDQDRRFEALFLHASDPMERVFEADPPERAVPGRWPCRREFDASVDKLISNAKRFESIATAIQGGGG